MGEDEQADMFSATSEIGFMRFLLADLHDDPSGGTILSGGQTTYRAWQEARSSFVHGNYIATVMLCQGMAEKLPASFWEIGEPLPPKISFYETLIAQPSRQARSTAS